MSKRWLIVALFNFLIAAIIGVLLRYAFVEEISWLAFKNFLHAHSHVAMLGWVYLALYTLVITVFLSDEQRKKRPYNSLFWITQLTVVGMLFSFPIQGYGLVAILFSGAHIICSYVFVRWLWRDLPRGKSFSVQLLRTALLFLILSTVAIWMMGPIMANQMKGSIIYYMAVQFYLHFQFNGWFLFAALALFFKVLENNEVPVSKALWRWFYGLLLGASFLTYALAVAWARPESAVFLANSTGVFVQLSAFGVLVRILWPQRKRIAALFSETAGKLLLIAALAFAGKVLIQALVIVPFVAEAAYTIRNYVIGFIHLVLLGAITFSLLAFIIDQNLLQARTRLTRWGLIFLVLGFLLSEVLLFLQGTMLWARWGFLPCYYELLFGFSVIIPLGILLFMLGQYQEVRGEGNGRA